MRKNILIFFCFFLFVGISLQIESLNSQTSKLEASAKAQNQELNTLTSQNEDLLKSKSNMEGKLISFLLMINKLRLRKSMKVLRITTLN